jgi:uncharacterized protein (DUF4415 family)
MKRAEALPVRLRKELAALDNLEDGDIDTSDIPEITDAEWSRRKVGLIYRPMKKSISLRLDADVLEWFKSKGSGYQTAMNRVLREHFARSQRP